MDNKDQFNGRATASRIPEEKKFLGRTKLGWAKIFIFYIIFYSCLGLFCFIYYTLFSKTLNYQMPKYILDDGLIGKNPGLGFRPTPKYEGTDAESSLIWLESNEPDSVKNWTKLVSEFIKPYESSYDFGTCGKDYSYGYSSSQPCVFLKLNKIYGWMPSIYKEDNLPQAMPEDLKNQIKSAHKKLIWVSCEAENPADVEHIGNITYYPTQGFPAEFYPYRNQKNYLQPIIAVQFRNPTKNVLIYVECKAWDPVITHDRADRKGSVHFELLID